MEGEEPQPLVHPSWLVLSKCHSVSVVTLSLYETDTDGGGAQSQATDQHRPRFGIWLSPVEGTCRRKWEECEVQTFSTRKYC